jgi:hypothetical protein
MMKKWQVIIAVILLFPLASVTDVHAQCSICTKTASQLGEKPAKGLNSGIVYLMIIPYAVAGYIGYRWWSREKAIQNDSSES